MDGLPGIESLFREHKRLASKLTKEELRALRGYLDNRLVEEHNDLIFSINALKTNFDTKSTMMEKTIQDLQKELNFKSELMEQYKSTDTNLATVHKKREERLEREQTVLVSDIDRLKKEVVSLTSQIETLARERVEMEREIKNSRIKISGLEKIALKVEAAERLIIQNEQMKQNLVKTKVNVDNRDREISRIIAEYEKISTENEQNKSMLKKAKEELNVCQTENKRLTKELSARTENLSIARYNLDIEKQKVRDLENELSEIRQIKEALPVEDKVDNGKNDSTGLRIELLKIHIQHLEGRVQLVEEKVQMYRNQARTISHDIAKTAQEISNMTSLKDKLIVHGTTVIERMLVDICDSQHDRKAKLEALYNDLGAHAPDIISKDAGAIKQDIVAVKKQAEIHKVSDISTKCARLIQRMEACEKAKLFFTLQHGQINGNSTNERNSVPSCARQENTVQRRSEENAQESSQTCFVRRKPPNIPLLGRGKITNGHPPFSAWRRKSSLSLDSGNSFSPALIDLNLSPSGSPSPREKSKTFFPHTSSSHSFSHGM